jgi:O-acetyl-ADP-ribose deacetylase (regulator of RNase III)/uncharacterized protein (UPF0248 family)
MADVSAVGVIELNSAEEAALIYRNTWIENVLAALEICNYEIPKFMKGDKLDDSMARIFIRSIDKQSVLNNIKDTIRTAVSNKKFEKVLKGNLKKDIEKMFADVINRVVEKAPKYLKTAMQTANDNHDKLETMGVECQTNFGDMSEASLGDKKEIASMFLNEVQEFKDMLWVYVLYFYDDNLKTVFGEKSQVYQDFKAVFDSYKSNKENQGDGFPKANFTKIWNGIVLPLFNNSTGEETKKVARDMAVNLKTALDQRETGWGYLYGIPYLPGFSFVKETDVKPVDIKLGRVPGLKTSSPSSTSPKKRSSYSRPAGDDDPADSFCDDDSTSSSSDDDDKGGEVEEEATGRGEVYVDIKERVESVFKGVAKETLVKKYGDYYIYVDQRGREVGEEEEEEDEYEPDYDKILEFLGLNFTALDLQTERGAYHCGKEGRHVQLFERLCEMYMNLVPEEKFVAKYPLTKKVYPIYLKLKSGSYTANHIMCPTQMNKDMILAILFIKAQGLYNGLLRQVKKNGDMDKKSFDDLVFIYEKLGYRPKYATKFIKKYSKNGGEGEKKKEVRFEKVDDLKRFVKDVEEGGLPPSSSDSSTPTGEDASSSTPDGGGDASSTPDDGGGDATSIPPVDLRGLKVIGKSFLVGKSKIYICKGSVVNFTGNVIVNAANTGGIMGGGIDGEINRAGKEELARARNDIKVIRKDDDGYDIRIETGSAVITKGRFGDLKCGGVIHAVGPDYSKAGETPELDKLLEQAYKKVVEICVEDPEITSVGSCLLSSGIYRGERDLGAVVKIALEAVRNALLKVESKEIEYYFVGFTDDEYTELLLQADDVFPTLNKVIEGVVDGMDREVEVTGSYTMEGGKLVEVTKSFLTKIKEYVASSSTGVKISVGTPVLAVAGLFLQRLLQNLDSIIGKTTNPEMALSEEAGWVWSIASSVLDGAVNTIGWVYLIMAALFVLANLPVTGPVVKWAGRYLMETGKDGVVNLFLYLAESLIFKLFGVRIDGAGPGGISITSEKPKTEITEGDGKSDAEVPDSSDEKKDIPKTFSSPFTRLAAAASRMKLRNGKEIGEEVGEDG